MRKFHKLAALCAVFILAVCFFSTVAYAAPADGTSTDTTGTAVTTGGTVSTPEGTGTVIASSTSGDKQFYTIKTPAGNTFYLIIDLSQKSNNVYFLDNVMEKDLLALANKDSSGTNAGTASTDPGTGTGGTAASPSATSSQAPASTSTQSSGPNFSMILLIAIVAVGGGVMFYVKVIRKKKGSDTRNEYEADDDEYAPKEPEANEYDTESEDMDDSQPWEENEE